MTHTILLLAPHVTSTATNSERTINRTRGRDTATLTIVPHKKSCTLLTETLLTDGWDQIYGPTGHSTRKVYIAISHKVFCRPRAFRDLWYKSLLLPINLLLLVHQTTTHTHTKKKEEKNRTKIPSRRRLLHPSRLIPSTRRRLNLEASARLGFLRLHGL